MLPKLAMTQLLHYNMAVNVINRYGNNSAIRTPYPMKFNQPTAELFIPDGQPTEAALARTTHLAIGAHQDDLEIMAIDGILSCFRQPDQWFTGIVVTNGHQPPRQGRYQPYTDAEMGRIRNEEQKKAAILGEYAAQILLAYPSQAIKQPANRQPVEELARLLAMTQPAVLYTHNLADKHDTHVAVAVRVIEAARQLPADQRPQRVYGCEVWRDLDWLVDGDKVAFDVSAQPNLQLALISQFDSQISGGKRYDLATMGRRQAHATYHTARATDAATGLALAMDLTPLIQDPAKDIAAYVEQFITRLADDVRQRITAQGGSSSKNVD